MKRKHICSLRFVNKFKFQENKFKIVQKKCWKKNIKKGSPGKATGHNDHYMINVGDQRQKIGGN